MSKCKSCQAPILWCVTIAGRRIPIDADGSGAPATFPDGTIAGTGRWLGQSREVRVLSDDEPRDRAWRTHFASCPNAKEHRQR